MPYNFIMTDPTLPILLPLKLYRAASAAASIILLTSVLLAFYVHRAPTDREFIQFSYETRAFQAIKTKIYNGPS